MNALLDRIFGLGGSSGGLGFGDPGVSLEFARPIPAWGWALVIAAAGALAFWSYSRLDAARSARFALATLRSLTLILLAVLLSGPQLVRPNDRVEKDWVLVLVDRSASLRIADAPGDGAAAGRSRDEQLRAALASAWPSLAQLAAGRTVIWMGFDGAASDIPLTREEDRPTGLALEAPEGRRTSIGAAIEQALSRATARPVSGIVVISDGRSFDEPSRHALRRLQSERIPIISVPLGSAEPVADLAVAQVDAPSVAFLKDTVPVRVEIERLGADQARGPVGSVRLIETGTGRVLDEQPLPEGPEAWGAGRAGVTLRTRPVDAGKTAWTVQLVPGGRDLVAENNAAAVAIELVDRPMRVLYLDGSPRWEYRYLKNLLVREASIEAATLLLASDRQFLQEGDILVDALPRSTEDWAKWDVVVMGDLSGTLLSREQLENLRDHVAVRGAGLLWIGGPGQTPWSWRDTALADLLPFTLTEDDTAASGPGARRVVPAAEPVLISPTDAARRLNLLVLADDPATPWPAFLSSWNTPWARMKFAQIIDPGAVKPTAEVVATFADQSGRQTPAVLSMRYGAGRVLYVATDETWRWRYARGETLQERFWLPLLRMQGREAIARSAVSALLELSPRRPLVEQPVRVSISLLDQSLVDSALPSLTVRVRRIDDTARAGQPAVPTAELRLSPDQGPGGADTGRAGARNYAATWLPSEPGRYRLEAADPALASLGLIAEADVTLPDDELRRPEADHALLARLSEQTGGQVLPPDRLSELPTLLPNREVVIAGTPDIRTLWDTPIMLALLALLLAAEWAGRRLVRLS